MQIGPIESRYDARSRANCDQLLNINDTVSAKGITIANSNGRYDFLETSTGDGTVSIIFSFTGTTSVFPKIVGTSKDTLEGLFDGWSVYYEANNRTIGVWLGYYNGTKGDHYRMHRLNAAIDLGKTYHLVLVKRGDLYTAYLNGAEVEVMRTYTVGNPTVVSGNDIVIGQRQVIEARTNSADINVAHLSIFNKAITAVEASALHSNGGQVPRSLHSNCVGYWTMQDRDLSTGYLIDSVEQFTSARELIRLLNPTFAGTTSEATSWVRGYSGAWSFDGGVATSPGGSIGALYQTNVPFVAGRTYKATFTITSIEVGASFVVTMGYANDTYNSSEPYTTSGTFSVTLTVPTGHNSVFYLQTFNGVVSVRDVKLEAVSDGPLTANHCELVGYSGAELGVPDRTTQTAMVDFYSKSVIAPPQSAIEKGIPIPSGNTPINLGCTTVDLGTSRNWGIHLSFYIDKDFAYDYNSGRFFDMGFDGGWCSFYKGRFLISMSMYYLDISPAAQTLTKGFHTLTFQTTGDRVMAFYDGVRVPVGHAGTGLVDEIHPLSGPLYMRNITNPIFYNSDNDMLAINFGIFEGNLTQREMAELHNNSLLNNPKKLGRWKCYYRFDSDGTTWPDSTGLCANATTNAPLTAVALSTRR